MSLVKLSYSEYEGQPQHWEVSDATFSDINLIVGKNASGKSRLLSVINSFARLLSGQHKPFESCKFSAIIKLSSQEFSYDIAFENGAISSEKLLLNGVEKLVRNNDGSGKIYYETEKKFLDFKLPPDAIAAVNRRDEKQHPYLIELHSWANGVVIYLFGSDFGKGLVMGLTEAETLFRNPNPPLFDDPNNLVGIYSSAFTRYGEEFDQSIIADMKTLGYSLADVGSDNIQTMMKVPFSAICLFTQEVDLGFKIPQMQISQGMFRALALSIHLNVCAFSKSKHLILVDDIGEGLDYERAVAIIDLLISKAQTHDMQIVMTSNDRFVMNKVPLLYWSVLKRTGGIVKMFNERNSKKQFEHFKYIGLNNFDFFASDYFNSELGDA